MKHLIIFFPRVLIWNNARWYQAAIPSSRMAIQWRQRWQVWQEACCCGNFFFLILQNRRYFIMRRRNRSRLWIRLVGLLLTKGSAKWAPINYSAYWGGRKEKEQKRLIVVPASLDKGSGKFEWARLVFPNNHSQSVFGVEVEAPHARRKVDPLPDWLHTRFIVTGVHCVQGNIQSIK